jgi:long-chain acyl-CoA synthetase
MHYGLTEASRSAYISFHDDQDKLDSIGRPSRGVEMRVTAEPGEDAFEAQGDAQGDAQGQIEIRGGHLMSEYWQDPDLTEKTLRDGWLRTGDIGRRDEDGYFHLSTRVSDIINVGGRKVSPNEIEDILLKHPAIEECVCLGIPDPQGLSGEIIVVYLVGRPGTRARPAFSELAKLLRQSLEPYKIPRQFHWVEQIPKSGSGKVLRQQLRDSSSP